MVKRTLTLLPLLFGTAANAGPQSDLAGAIQTVKTYGAKERSTECGQQSTTHSLEFDASKVTNGAYDNGALFHVDSDDGQGFAVGLIDFQMQGYRPKVTFGVHFDVVDQAGRFRPDGNLDLVLEKQAGLFGMLGWGIDMLADPCNLDYDELSKVAREPTAQDRALYQRIISSF